MLWNGSHACIPAIGDAHRRHEEDPDGMVRVRGDAYELARRSNMGLECIQRNGEIHRPCVMNHMCNRTPELQHIGKMSVLYC